MAGEITTVSQPMDNFIEIIFKWFDQKHYDLYMLSAPENDKGQPMPQIQQICAQWGCKSMRCCEKKTNTKGMDSLRIQIYEKKELLFPIEWIIY